MGGPTISGRTWCGHLLNVDEAYLFSIHSFILGTFSRVEKKGHSFGFGGVGFLFGQPHSASSISLKESLEETPPTSWSAIAPPSRGKSFGIT